MTQHLLLKSFTPVGGNPQDLATINVLIGPSQSGKSETLRDLARLAGNFEPTGEERAKGEEPQPRVLQDVTFVSKLSVERLLKGITTYDAGSEEGRVAQGLGPDLQTPYRRSIPHDLKNVLLRPVMTARSVWLTGLGDLMPLRIAYLSTEGRRQLLAASSATSPIRPTPSVLAALHLAGAEVASRLRSAVADIFPGVHLQLDPTDPTQLVLRVSPQPFEPSSDALDDALRLSRMPTIDQFGDGVQHVAALIAAVLVSPGRVLLLDEPEQGLMPETSRRLAAWIADHAAALQCQVVLTTKDPHFLAGLYGGGADVLIWRLSRRESQTRFEVVPTEVGRALTTFPLFTSQLAIHSIFREGVVVTADASDRVVYQGVAERLVRAHNLGFVNAQGARNLTFVTTAFRRANVPTCVVCELDFLQSETQFAELVKALSGKPPTGPWLATRERLAQHVEGAFDARQLSAHSNEVEAFLDDLKKPSAASSGGSATRDAGKGSRSWDRLRQEQLAALPPELRLWVEELLEDLKRIGLFVSPKGRLEKWMEFAADEEDPGGWLNRAMQLVHGGDCPPELRAFVTEMAGQLQASLSAPRVARGSHSA